MTSIRNIAIIAHVDHGKTTLVDKMIEAGNVVNERDRPTGELIMDNNDLERERGITIVSKNVSVSYKGTKINIIDTPGHADFGGEVERVLNMADGVCLLVDAFEGPMPQTRFVLGKALSMGLKPLLVINKVDKDNCTPDEVQEKVFDLMFELDANEEQLEFPTIYGSAKNGWMSTDWKNPKTDITDLLDQILDYFPPRPIEEGNTQMLITSLDFSTYVGRIAIGRLHRGDLKENQQIVLAKRDGSQEKHRVKELFVFDGNINGSVNFKQDKAVYRPTASLVIDHLNLNNTNLGTLDLDIEGDESLSKFAINSAIIDNDFESFNASGNLIVQNNETLLDLRLKLDQFKLATLDPIGGEVLSNIRGMVSGNATVQGNINRPEINGRLYLDKAGMSVPYLGVDYFLMDKTIVDLTDEKFLFRNNLLTDSKFATKGVLNGTIEHNNFSDWKLDLGISSKRLNCPAPFSHSPPSITTTSPLI